MHQHSKRGRDPQEYPGSLIGSAVTVTMCDSSIIVGQLMAVDVEQNAVTLMDAVVTPPAPRMPPPNVLVSIDNEQDGCAASDRHGAQQVVHPTLTLYGSDMTNIVCSIPNSISPCQGDTAEAGFARPRFPTPPPQAVDGDLEQYNHDHCTSTVSKPTTQNAAAGCRPWWDPWIYIDAVTPYFRLSARSTTNRRVEPAPPTQLIRYWAIELDNDSAAKLRSFQLVESCSLPVEINGERKVEKDEGIREVQPSKRAALPLTIKEEFHCTLEYKGHGFSAEDNFPFQKVEGRRVSLRLRDFLRTTRLAVVGVVILDPEVAALHKGGNDPSQVPASVPHVTLALGKSVPARASGEDLLRWYNSQLDPSQIVDVATLSTETELHGVVRSFF